MNELDGTLRSLHACYCTLTHQQPPYVTCERRWLEFHNAGLALDDLRLTIGHVVRLNKERANQFRLSLRFGNFIGDLERFGDLLGEARAEKRAKDYKAKHSYPAAKAEVLRATGRPDTIPLEEEPKPAKEIVRGMLQKGFEDALKEAEESIRLKP